MPATPIEFFQEKEGKSQVVAWLEDLKMTDRKAYAKCAARIQRLAEVGHELRRPEADFLRDGIHELRSSKGTVNYRILYFFHGRTAAILAVGLTKEAAVPPRDIDQAVAWKALYSANPEKHRFIEKDKVLQKEKDLERSP
jgi:hypothetical protein